MTPLLNSTQQVLGSTLESPCKPADVLVTFAEQPGMCALESVCNTGGYGNLSIIACAPVSRLEVPIVSPSGEPVDALAELAAALERHPPVSASPAPFAGAWIGYLPYEAGAVLEGVGRSDGMSGMGPRMYFALYDSAAVFEHRTRTWHVCAVDIPESTTGAHERLDRLTTLIRASEDRSADRAVVAQSVKVARPVPNMTKDEYIRKVKRAIRYIEAGDIYQVNLTQRFMTRIQVDPLALYLRLREANPADYAAYLRWGDSAVLSSSPELFLDLGPDGRVVTRPIKGTTPRSGNPATDAARRLALLASEKDRAELNMIIDLLRNDLGKVCEYGSVRVRKAGEVETHPTVLHLVATIEGRLRAEVSPIDLLRASFPGGSITGCPKIRAMQIINQLEPTPRGVYCGSIGYIGLDGRMSFNIAIRTMVCEAGSVRIHAGGAITADSDPEAEYREVLAKAEGMFRAVGHSTRDLLGADLPW